VNTSVILYLLSKAIEVSSSIRKAKNIQASGDRNCRFWPSELGQTRRITILNVVINYLHGGALSKPQHRKSIDIVSSNSLA